MKLHVSGLSDKNSWNKIYIKYKSGDAYSQTLEENLSFIWMCVSTINDLDHEDFDLWSRNKREINCKDDDLDVLSSASGD